MSALALEPTLWRDPRRDCRMGGGRNNPRLTLLAVLVEHTPGRPSLRPGNWRVLDPADFEDIAAFLNHRDAQTPVQEMREMAKSHRDTIEFVSIGDGQYRYRLTETGVAAYQAWRRQQ